MQMSFPETVSGSLCRNYFYANRLLQNLFGWLVSDDLEVKMLDVKVLGWCGYTWSVVVRPVGCTAVLEWPFIVASLRHTCAIIMLSNQHLDMPRL